MVDLRFEPLFFAFALDQELRQRLADDAGQHVGAEVGDLGRDHRQTVAQRIVTALCMTGNAVQLARELVGEDARMLGREQVMLEHRQRPVLYRRLADRHGVAASTALLLAGAAIIVLAADGVVRAAHAAADEAGQEVLLAVLAA
ncbi:hypothetical protein JW805_14125 [Roseomonas aeriglobus]|nr:hypothetical protein [Roseomonas aeriglobus]